MKNYNRLLANADKIQLLARERFNGNIDQALGTWITENGITNFSEEMSEFNDQYKQLCYKGNQSKLGSLAKKYTDIIETAIPADEVEATNETVVNIAE